MAVSYDFDIAVETAGGSSRYIGPSFDDCLPGLDSDGMAGSVAVTATGYSRCGNYTSNVSGMWTLCLTAAMQAEPRARVWAGDDDRALIERGVTREIDTEHLCLRDLDGKTASELAPVLKAAVEWGLDHIDELRELNPGNGWGNAEGAVTYLWDIQRMCERHPEGRLVISS